MRSFNIFKITSMTKLLYEEMYGICMKVLYVRMFK